MSRCSVCALINFVGSDFGGDRRLAVPCEGIWKTFFEHLTTAAIALLFFMHGAKLSREAIVAGMSHWKLHLLVFLSTFALFPLLGLAMNLLVPGIMTPTVYLGFLYCARCRPRCNRPSPLPQRRAATWRRRSAALRRRAFSACSCRRCWWGR